MNDYDIGAAFAAIENELIDSMLRNMKRHKAEEAAEGFEWAMWQAEQLKALEQYKRKNAQQYRIRFRTINAQLEQLVRQAYEQGGMEQEAQILNAVRNGFSAPVGHRMEGAFFKLNDRRLNALIQAVTDDVEKAEYAVLRRANDEYRKIIFNAQMYANAGAGTYEKAVDMAARDFLSRGIQCVIYSNGARHTLRDYAEMAIRTASKRAYLQGEGAKRQEWGIHTVILAKRGNPCPLCAPFCGKVFIDDVWSGGKASDGNYPMLSGAIAKGLYHPRCKDSHTTFFPDISTESRPWTVDERKRLTQDYNREQKQRYAERQAEKYRRLAEYSLDEDNLRIYRERAKQWSDVVDYMSNSFRPKYVKHDDLTIALNAIKVKKVLNSQFDMVTDIENSKRNKAVRLAEKILQNIQKKLPDDFEIPTIAVVDFEKHGLNADAIGGYHKISGVLYINSKYDTPKKILDFVNKVQGQFANTTEYAPYLHELGHKYYEDCIKYLAKTMDVPYNKAKDIIDSRIYAYVHEMLLNGESLAETLSEYASAGYSRHGYTEVIAESFSVRDSNNIAIEILSLLGEN